MVAHFTQEHPFRRRKGETPWVEVAYQQFTPGGRNQTMFRVRAPSAAEHEQARRQEDVAAGRVRGRYQVEVMQRLDAAEAALAARSTQCLGPVRPTEVSPWLEATRWHQYLGTYPLHRLAALAEPCDAAREPLLALIGESLQRVVEAASESVCADRINVFDQLRVNTFASDGRLFDRPLMVKLQKGTWRSYIGLWKRFLCFVVRSTRPDQATVLLHRLTEAQQEALDNLLDQVRTLSRAERGDCRLERLTDRACLLLCISLLDHHLRGSMFESVALGFLAILGIDSANETLRDAPAYTPTLSRFIKIGQLLMIQRAVLEVDERRAEYPAEILEEMCGRFLVDNTLSPLAWAIRLRAIGRKIQTSMTLQGCITWSEDQETLSYRDVELSMTQFRAFVVELLREAQQSLRHLLLLHEEEEVIAVVPRLPLHEVKDNPANTAHGWCFLHDPRNQSIFQPGKRWLMTRIFQNSWLQDEFICPPRDRLIKWKDAAVQDYFAEVTRFLKLLLLLVHLTAGQPARGTEVMSLRYLNSTFHRNIFIEHGLVATVTSYHKGYSVQGSTKIIHRYVPRPVSELIIYYLWLIVPFWRQLDLLNDSHTTSTTQSWL